MKAKQKKKTIKRKLDLLWSKLIKKRAGYKCERCLKKGRLNTHHIFSRRYLSLRWIIQNGVRLCVGCHYWAHQNPVEFTDWIRELRGNEVIDWLIRLKNTQFKVDLEEVEKYLKERRNRDEN